MLAWDRATPNYNDICFTGGSCAAAPSYSGPGDVIPTWQEWGGLRAFTAAIAAAGTQKLVNFRNTVTNETCDVIVATNGGFGNVANCSASSNGDTVAVFCAESSGTYATTEVYDQTGNAKHSLQTTAANQPIISLSCLNSLPCLPGAGSYWLKSTATIAGSAQPYSFEMMLLSNGSANSYAGAIDNARPFFVRPLNKCLGYELRNRQSSFTAATNVAHIFNGTCNGASSIANLDGTENSLSAGTAIMSAFDINIMTIADGYAPLHGQWFEEGFAAGGWTPTQRGNLCHSANVYYSLGLGC